MIEIVVGFFVLIIAELFNRKPDPQCHQEHIIPVLDIFDENGDNYTNNIDSSDFDGEGYDLADDFWGL